MVKSPPACRWAESVEPICTVYVGATGAGGTENNRFLRFELPAGVIKSLLREMRQFKLHNNGCHYASSTANCALASDFHDNHFCR